MAQVDTETPLRVSRRNTVVQPKIVVSLLGCWGLIVAVFGIWHLSATVPAAPFMGTRMTAIQQSIEVLDRGGPPLLGADEPYHAGIAVGHLVPVGVGDDQGIYLWLPLLGHWTGQSNPAVLMKWLYVGCFGLLLLVYPLIFYALFGSAAVSVAAPLLVLWKFNYAQDADIYWIQLWAMLLGLPAVFAAFRQWNRNRAAAIALLVGAMFVASFSTSIRIHSGLPILIAGLIVVLAADGRWWRRARERWTRPVIALSLIVAYLSIGTLALGGARAYRDHVVHANLAAGHPSVHPFWHNAYIGLGYLPNRYGIAWNDAVSSDAVERARPGTGYLTKPYEATLRHLYWRLFRADPGFVLDNLRVKSKRIIDDALGRYLWMFLLLPVALLFGRDRRAMRWFVLLAVPALLLGALSPVLTIPAERYELGWLGAWGALSLVTFGWLAAVAINWLRAPHRAGLPAGATARTTGAAVRGLVTNQRVLLLVAVVLAVVLVDHFLSPTSPPDASGAYAAEQSDFGPASLQRLPTTNAWTFSGPLPRGWVLQPGGFTEPDRGATYVRTTMLPAGTALSTAPVSLEPGRYHVLVDGLVLVGGLQVRVVDASSGAVLATSKYSAFQAFGREPMVVGLESARPLRVRIVLSNWSPFPNAGAWVLSRVSIART